MLDLRTGKEMTRRETIKGGLGLAAILAAGKAPAMLLGARGVAFGGGKPYKTRLQYLIGSGNGYFDTDVEAANDVGVKCQNCNIAYISSNYMVFGVFGSNNRYGIGGGKGYGFGWWNIALESAATIPPFYYGSLNYLNDRKFKYNNNSAFDLVSDYNNYNTIIRIFNAKRGDTGTSIFNDAIGNMGDVYISRGTSEIRHYIPVISNDDTVEFYDLHTKTFATRVGTFTAGPAVVE